MQPGERVQVYLTNTVEPISPDPNFLLPALSREVERAQQVKDKPILIIMGNPPYAGKSKNNGAWIVNQIRTYKSVDGKPLDETNTRWLQNDYVKFIQFAQYKMEQVERGVVGIITAHSFLDNLTFSGMRQSLMRTFSDIYVLDLHGSLDKRERAPDGGKDENVFDIETGVCISVFVRDSGRAGRKVYHSDFWGRRSSSTGNALIRA